MPSGTGLPEDWMGRTELTCAIINKDTPLALKLLECYGDPNHTDNAGCSDLYFAAAYSEPEVLRELLRKGADPDGRHGRMLPLLGALDSVQQHLHQTEFDAYGQAFEMVKALLEAGADPDLSQSGMATIRQNAKYLAPGPIAEYMKTCPKRNPREEGV